MTPYFTYPNIDPVAFSLGPLDVRWYSLAYMVAFIAGWRYCMALAAKDTDKLPSPKQVDDFLVWAVLGVILGGRIGYVLFYNLAEYIQNPADMLKIWHGGMSFHGGLLGMATSTLVYSYRHKIPALRLGDILACAAPIGFFFGRIANFINGELYGRVTDSPFSMVFPHGGSLPRYPSQLFEAFFEGLVLFFLLLILAQFSVIRNRNGLLFGIFLMFYGAARFVIEYWREPDIQLGFIVAHFTMGQILCFPMVVIGVILALYSFKTVK